MPVSPLVLDRFDRHILDIVQQEGGSVTKSWPIESGFRLRPVYAEYVLWRSTA